MQNDKVFKAQLPSVNTLLPLGLLKVNTPLRYLKAGTKSPKLSIQSVFT